MSAWLHVAVMKDIAFAAVIIISNLLLQKPSKKSKSNIYQTPLERRLELWRNSKFLQLLRKGGTQEHNLRHVTAISKEFPSQMSKEDNDDTVTSLTSNMKDGFQP